jgi:adenosine deaminase
MIRRSPKVLLHEHLDGGLRPATVVDLARANGVEIPTDDPNALAQWFARGADRGNLSLYLEGFATTIACMQTAEALRRVAREAILDLHEDGVVYTELRFAPFFHTRQGLTLEQVMASVLEGLREGQQQTGVAWGLIVCALRSESPALSLEMAELAVAFRNQGVVGFDLAGDEFGHPPKRHIEAFQYCRRMNFPITIHAGEAFGKESIWQALQYCGALRIGHCTRLTEDIARSEDGRPLYGALAHWIRDRRIPLEMCLSSNVHTGAVSDLTQHPFRALLDARFRVTLNTDNRLMSATTMTAELTIAVTQFGLTQRHLELLAINAMKSAFIHYDERCDLIYGRIKPGFQALHESNSCKGPAAFGG